MVRTAHIRISLLFNLELCGLEPKSRGTKTGIKEVAISVHSHNCSGDNFWLFLMERDANARSYRMWLSFTLFFNHGLVFFSSFPCPDRGEERKGQEGVWKGKTAEHNLYLLLS